MTINYQVLLVVQETSNDKIDVYGELWRERA